MADNNRQTIKDTQPQVSIVTNTTTCHNTYIYNGNIVCFFFLHLLELFIYHIHLGNIFICIKFFFFLLHIVYCLLFFLCVSKENETFMREEKYTKEKCKAKEFL